MKNSAILPRTLMSSDEKFLSIRPHRAPGWWRSPCANTECTLHQLSPYIGKIKSSIAGDLIELYSGDGDLVVDPFSGSGTIPLEGAIRGRKILAADISPYARILSKAKLSPPKDLPTALRHAESALIEARALPVPDLRAIPTWVRQFFHPRTLKEALRFASVARSDGNEFLMSCLLGILHHQRPGFLSYPSSHLVPYLRARKYPKAKFPEMYEYRDLRPRLLAKICRTYRRTNRPYNQLAIFHQRPVADLKLPRRIGAIITSPPYMNALDYGRDNRLRLWFIDPKLAEPVRIDLAQRRKAFIDSLSCLAVNVERTLKLGGFCVLVVGEEVQRSYSGHPSEVAIAIFKHNAPSLRLKRVITDNIPDVRRSRRDCRGVKTEHVLVLQRIGHAGKYSR